MEFGCDGCSWACDDDFSIVGDWMKFVIFGEISHNDVQVMAQVFFHHLPFEVVEAVPDAGLCLMVKKSRAGNVTVTLFEAGETLERAHIAASPGEREAVPIALGIYEVLSKFTGYKPPWGLLTGIRPAKIFTKLYNEGMSKRQAIFEVMKTYRVQLERARLCADVAATQGQVMKTSPEDAVSVYIGIAFCPTVCDYCSFSAYPMDKFGDRESAYVDALIKEIGQIERMSRFDYVENIYIGGGTPTALSDENFARILDAVKLNFDTERALEYTVEAGRPDTITPAKLALMKIYGVNRISINPQTLKDETLAKIGRAHTVDDFFKAYLFAREFGFKHINFDLILGLEGEDITDVENTLEGIVAMKPDSVTIHQLAVKRASKLHEQADTRSPDRQDMLELCSKYMEKAQLEPYYLYRQKNSPGNFENVGYAKKGYAGRYNIHMMEETRSVYAAGCGAVTKLVDQKTGKIERVTNLRDLDQYISRIDELIEKKGGL